MNSDKHPDFPENEMCQELKVARVGSHVVHVQLNRPEKRNAINGVLTMAIDGVVKETEADVAVRAVVLSSSGEQSFCAGADLAEIAAGRHAELLTKDGGFAGLIEATRLKPWIAAVDAPALGGGMEICLACDMIVASHRASFALPEVKRGLFAGAGGVFRSARRLPPAIAHELLATGDAISGERAFAYGMVNRLVPAGEATQAALLLAAAIAENAPLAVQQALKLAKRALDLDEPALFAAMRDAGAIIRDSADAREGMRAFLEKRKPDWTGR